MRNRKLQIRRPLEKELLSDIFSVLQAEIVLLEGLFLHAKALITTTQKNSTISSSVSGVCGLSGVKYLLNLPTTDC